MNGQPSPAVDSVWSCALMIGVLCLTLLVLGAIVLWMSSP